MSAPTAFTLTRLHENKIRTLESRVYPFFKMGVRLFTRCPRPATRLAIPDIQLRARFSPTALFRTKDIQNDRRIRHRRAFDPRVARFLKRQRSALTCLSAGTITRTSRRVRLMCMAVSQRGHERSPGSRCKRERKAPCP